MAHLDKLAARVLADGHIDDDEVEVIRKELYADGKIDQDEVEFLIGLRNQAKATCPAFETLLFGAVKEYVLADGRIDQEEVAWLRKMLYADGKIDPAEKKFLADLH